jgi:hypothetical protein
MVFQGIKSLRKQKCCEAFVKLSDIPPQQSLVDIATHTFPDTTLCKSASHSVSDATLNPINIFIASNFSLAQSI